MSCCFLMVAVFCLFYVSFVVLVDALLVLCVGSMFVIWGTGWCAV